MSADKRPITVKIRNNKTGEIVDYATTGSFDEDGFSDYIWSEGNYSCDCNRSRFFDGIVEYEDKPCGEEKYSIQIIDPSTNQIIYDEFGP